jgi:epoxyqueuosine reductase QueG
VSFARATGDAAFTARGDVAEPDLRALATMDAGEFERRYSGTPFSRPGYRGMRRNAAAILDR